MGCVGRTVDYTDSAQVPCLGGRVGRTRSPAMGSGGGARTGLGRGLCGGAGHASFAHHDHGGTAGTGLACGTARGRGNAGAPARRRTQSAHRNGSRPAGRLGSVDRTHDARRPGIALALDLQEYATIGRRVDAATSRGGDQYLSVNPAMTRSAKGQEILSRIPRERMLTETDGPFTREGNRPSFPWDVEAVERHLAELWQESVERVRDQIWTNFRKQIDRLKRTATHG